MSTRGNIAIKLNDADTTANLLYDPSKEPRTPRDITDKVYPINPAGKKYLQIYNHHDSYPSGLGYLLLKYYTDYDTVLNLILAGDTSSVGTINTAAYVQNDDYDDTKPQFLDAPELDEEYLYVYEDGKWFIQGHEFENLTELTLEMCK